jgi:two-component system, NarL family, nitrate/nitrite response regulator NarL
MDSVTVIGSRTLFRAGLVDLLRAIGFNPIEEADDSEQLKRGATLPTPADLLVIGLVRGVDDVTTAVGEIRSWAPAAKIVCLVPEFDLEVMRRCFAAGASGYLLESISRDALRESLRLVYAGEKVFPSELAAQFPILASRSARADSSLAQPDTDLSCREVEILQCLAVGLSNKAIAKNLNIAEATVKVHVKRILRKAHALNRTQAALWGIAVGVASAPGLNDDEAVGSSFG